MDDKEVPATQTQVEAYEAQLKLQREDIQALVYWITRPWNKIDPGDPIRKILQRYQLEAGSKPYPIGDDGWSNDPHIYG